MKLIFIRHGETTGDVEDRYGGAYDDGLSERGFEQAAGLEEELRGRGITTVIASGLQRAQQVGMLLAEAVGAGFEVDEDFSERNQYAELSGMVKAEAKALHPELVEKLKDRMFTMPGAESYEDFSVRVSAAFEDLAGVDGTAVVWHGGCMRVLFRDILEMGELTEIGDCCWVELVRDGGAWRVGESRRIGFEF
jgi:probable phosphoglycerate mutase